MHLADINDVNRDRNMLNFIIVPLQLKKMVIVTMQILTMLLKFLIIYSSCCDDTDEEAKMMMMMEKKSSKFLDSLVLVTVGHCEGVPRDGGHFRQTV